MASTHDCGADAAAYALGALEPAEAEAFRRHLQQCAVCREELRALQGIVQALPMAAPQYRAPRRLRRRVLRAARQEARTKGRPAGSPASTRMRALSHPLARPALALLASAAVAAAAFGAVELSTGRGGRLIPARVAGISGRAELRLTDGRAELIVHHLAPPPGGEVYEVWLRTPPGPPRPASVLFSVGAGGDADVGLPENMRGVREVMVTAEPHGGTQTPTHPPVIVAQLT